MRDLAIHQPAQRELSNASCQSSELIASSEGSFNDAVKGGLVRACKTLKHVSGARVKDHTEVIDKNSIVHYRVNPKVTFIVED